MSVFKTFVAEPAVFAGEDATVRVTERFVHGPGTVNVGIGVRKGSSVLSLNLTAGKARELRDGLNLILGQPNKEEMAS